MAADETALGKLHEKVATVLCDALEGQKLPEIRDEEGELIQEATVMPVSAAHITAAIQFLKNNNVTCVADKSNALGQLQEKMKAREEKRAAKRRPTSTDLIEAERDAGWLGGAMGHA